MRRIDLLKTLPASVLILMLLAPNAGFSEDRKKDCGPGGRTDARTKRCICPAGYAVKAGRCACPEGQTEVDIEGRKRCGRALGPVASKPEKPADAKKQRADAMDRDVARPQEAEEQTEVQQRRHRCADQCKETCDDNFAFGPSRTHVVADACVSGCVETRCSATAAVTEDAVAREAHVPEVEAPGETVSAPAHDAADPPAAKSDLAPGWIVGRVAYPSDSYSPRVRICAESVADRMLTCVAKELGAVPK